MQQISIVNFSNPSFKQIFEILKDFYAENDNYHISDFIQYTDSSDLREMMISLDNYDLNLEPFDHEIEDYIATLMENNDEDSIEILNHKLNEAQRTGDIDMVKYYLQMIVQKINNECDDVTNDKYFKT